MKANNFPSDPSGRHAILVLDREDYDLCRYDPQAGRIMLEKGLHVMPLPVSGDRDSLPIALRNIADARLLKANALLIQNPYDGDDYVSVDEVFTRFPMEKLLYFSSFCGLLGAKEVKIEQADIRIGNKKLTINGGIESPYANADIAIDQETIETLKKTMQILDEYSGGNADIAEAESFLRRKYLWSDATLRSLLDVRKDGRNQLTSRRMVVNITSEAQSSLSVIGNLTVPGYIQVTGDYKKVVNEKHDYTLTVNVKF